MTSFEWYYYKDTTYGLTHLPENNQLINETTLYLYYVSATDPTQLWKYTKATGADVQLDVDPDNDSGDNKSRMRKIQATWIDRANDLIYFADCDNDGVDDKYDTWKIDYSDDTVTDISSDIDPNVLTNIYIMDVFLEGADLYTLIWNDPAGVSGIYVFKNGAVVEEDSVNGGEPSKVVKIGTLFYFVSDTSPVAPPWQALICYYDTVAGTITPSTELTDVEGASTINLKGVAYDGTDTLYFIFEDRNDGNKNKLVKYVISTTTATMLEESNVSLMLDRNTLGTANSPVEYEKGFHLTSSFVYRIAGDNFTNQFNLIKLQDLGLTGGATIKAITDTYLIDSNKNVWKYTESITDMHTARASYQTHRTPKGRFSHADEFSTDQLIEIWTDVPELAFRGKMGTPKYDQRRGLWNYAINNMGYDDLREKISYTATAEGIDEVVIALFGQLTNPYLYTDTTATPNIATNMTYTFDDEPLKDALYVCAILGNAFPWYEPNGYSYFRAYSNADPTGWYYGSPDNFNLEPVGTTGTSIAWVDTDNGGITEIVAEIGDHKNVLRAFQAVGGATYHNFSGATGAVEFWVRLAQVNIACNISIMDGGEANSIYILFNNDGNIYYLTPGGNLIQAYAADTWYHFKIEWDCAADWHLWIGGISKDAGAGYAYNGNPTTMDLVRLQQGAGGYIYMDAWGVGSNSKYEVGYNQYDMYSNTIGNMGNPKVNKHQAQFNDFSNVRGGWDEANSKPFSPTTPLIDEHVQQYGKKLWKGRKIFSGAITQASLDAIVAGLKAWQGMVSNPVDASFKVKQYYYPVGYQVGLHFTLNDLIPNALGMLIVGNLTNFKKPNLIDLATSTNIVRRR